MFASKSNPVKGWFGERIVTILARFFLDRKAYHLIYNVTLPTEDRTTQIDHIIVSRYGIFAVETKNVKGWIFASENNGEWTQHIHGQASTFQNPLRQNYRHAKALEEILGLMPDKIFPVIVFVGDSTFKTVMPEHVMHPGGYIKYITSKTEPLFGDFEVEDIIKKIKAYRFDPGSKISTFDLENLKNQHSPKINRKLRRAGREHTSPYYRLAVIVAMFLVFGAVAYKTILKKQDVVDQNRAAAGSGTQPSQPEQSTAREELNNVYQYRDAQGKIRYTNSAAAANAKLVDPDIKNTRAPLSVEIIGNEVFIPVTIRNKGMQMETKLLLDKSFPITILPMTTADFFETESLGAATVATAEGKTIAGEKRIVSYFAAGDTAEPQFIFLASSETTRFASAGILGRDFAARHPFSIDYEKKALIWE